MFSQGGSTSDWTKPQGASFVWFTLIGAGGAGFITGTASSRTGGGSGAVTNFMGPAFLMPDVLRVNVGLGGRTTGAAGTASTVVYQQKNDTGYELLSAAAGTGGASGSVGVGGAASTSNYFSAMGFFQSVAGQNGTQSTAYISPSTTTFLSGGQGDQADFTAGNYGYLATNGYFQLQPIIVGIGGSRYGAGGIGCGGGGSNGVANLKPAGDGLVVIITW